MKNTRFLQILLFTIVLVACAERPKDQAALVPQEASQVQTIQLPATISIHANIDAETVGPTWLRFLQLVAGDSDFLAELEVAMRGHAWISVNDANGCRTYGMFGEGPTQNLEISYLPGHTRTHTLTADQSKSLLNAIREREDYKWLGYYNCASYATDLWEAATGENIGPVPSRLYAIKEGVISENSALKPLPPSPLGVAQRIEEFAQRDGVANTSSNKTVCP